MAPSGLRQCVRDISPYLLLLIGVSTLGSLQFGLHLAELNAPQDVITCHKKSISTRLISAALGVFSSPDGTTRRAADLPDCIPMDAAAFAVVSSIFTLGGLIGALAAGPLSSARGRLFAMRATSALFLLGSAVETLAASIPVLAAGRLLTGIGAGASTVIVPLYISEVAPPRERGLFGFMTQISINVGILGTQTMGYFLSYGSAWRWILGAGVIAGAAHIIGLLLVPESPAWLAANRSVTKARATLQRIRGRGYDIEEEVAAWGGDSAAAVVIPEEEGLLSRADAGDLVVQPPSRRESNASKAGKGNGGQHMGFLQVLRDPDTRPAIIAVVGIMFSQQLCGINSIIMYSVSLLADLLPISSALLTIVISIINLGVTIACAPLPDKLGRKTCLLLSIVGQGTSALCLAIAILSGVKILSAIAVLFFVGFFAVGLGPVPFMMASELVGQEAVGATQSWGLGANYVATFLVAQFFPIVNAALNARFGGAGWVYFIFAALAACCAAFVYLRVPETKGKKDADEVWGKIRRLD
ncbi:major facilitator superfamily domain-containing protein [Xylariales sp. PMI_506]|nr:major facilitator superfamily domain-containing protein [Xylariales sp. PMI_506]